LKLINLSHFYFYLSIFLLLGCESEYLTPGSERSGAGFFPLEVGQYRTYYVEDITFSFLEVPDTNRFFLKEVVADSFINQTNTPTYRLERFTRATDSMPWHLDSVWTATKDTRRVVITENNVPFIKLIFPLRSDLQWDGNALNTWIEDIYELQPSTDELLHEIESPIDSLLNSSITVIQERSQDTTLAKIDVLETYAENTGLFYKKTIRLQVCNTDTACLGQGIIEAGQKFKQTLIEHGKE
jgi:hypothetical protein